MGIERRHCQTIAGAKARPSSADQATTVLALIVQARREDASGSTDVGQDPPDGLDHGVEDRLRVLFHPAGLRVRPSPGGRRRSRRAGVPGRRRWPEWMSFPGRWPAAGRRSGWTALSIPALSRQLALDV
jgi:hypothetical protein